MKKIYTKLFILLLFVLGTMCADAQNVNVNPGAGSYLTLKAAFDAINLGTHTGAVTIDIVDNTTETASAILNASGAGAASYTSIAISPSGGVARTITGAIAGHLIDLNAADNVTIDGLNASGNTLTISNTATGASSTIRFIGDATNNIIQKTTLQGSTTSFGVVYFSTGTITGNDGNNINNCDITAAGTNLPINGIYSLGTATVGIENSSVVISTNSISDYYSAATATSGMNINTGNSTWTITNNKLFQSATRIYTTAATHNGIFITTGDGYTITGNTIGFANTTGTGTTNVVGNTVALTGTFPSSYTVTGTANATRYIALNCTFNVAGTVSSIQNNTIAGFALYTSSGASTANGIFCAIQVLAGNANIGTTTGNTIGATSGTGSIYTACTTSGGMAVGIYVTSANTGTIQNNTIGAIDAMGTTSSISGSITGINIAGAGNFTVSGNTIGNATNPNLRMGNLTTGANLSNVGTTFGIATGTGAFKGIFAASTGTTKIIGTAVLPNIITKASLNSSSTGSTFRGIEVSGAAGVPVVSSNSISNITSASTNITLTSGGIAGIGIYVLSGATGSTLAGNFINTLSLTNTTTTGTNLAGISTAATTVTISKNLIYGLSNASTSTTVTTPGTASGILIRSGVASVAINISNNMISLGVGETTNTSFIGIWGQHGSTPDPITNIYFNSINIEGSASSGAQPSFGYLRADFSTTARTPTVDIRNNIFTNTRSGGTGKHYAIANNYGTTASATGWGTNASDYNVLNGTAANIGYWTTDKTFAAWKTASASDVSSLSGITVIFVNTATGDLHLNMGTTPTAMESGGITGTGITDDYDNQVRPGPAGSVNGGATAPDLGADEFDGVFLDIIGPIISYTLIANSLCTTERTLAPVTITDASGVNITAGTKPRLYFKKSTDANAYVGNTSADNGWKYVEASNASSPFSFTTNYALLQSAVAGGDIIQYFVVAQDMAASPNVGINSGTFAATPASVALTPAAFPIGGTINQYLIVAGGLSSDVTIGAAGTYPTLTGVGGLFEAINTSGLTNNITASILDAAITETGAVSLNAITYGCAGSYTLLVKPAAGVTTVISGTVATTSMINLNGADNITFDGSNNGTSSKNMTLRNSSTTGAVIRFINDATFNTVKNSILEGGVTSTTSGVVAFSTSTGTLGNSNNTIMNNDIRDKTDVVAAFANSIYSAGSAGAPNASNTISGNNLFNFNSNGINMSSTGIGNGWQITGNNIYNAQATPSAVTQNGILITGGTGHMVSGNFVGGNAAGATGLWTNTGNVIFTGIAITGGVATISNNTIANIATTNIGTTARTRGIVHTSTGDSIYINNNNIFNLTSFGAIASYVSGSQPVAGIYAFPTTTFHVYFVSNNVIHDLSAENTSALTTSNLACGIVLTNFSGECFKNKIYNIRNKSTGTTAGQPPIATGIYARFFDSGYVYNNMIALGEGETNNVQFNGIMVVGGGDPTSDQHYYYNSIRIAGTANGTFSSHGFLRGDNSVISPTHPVDLKNNILSMERAGAGSVNYAIASQGVGAATGWSSDYNDLYNVVPANIGFWDATGYDFANWKTTSAGDANSLSIMPEFVSTTDLHLTVNNAAIDNKGIVIAGITTDIDGQTRGTGVVPSPNAPDMGADEFAAAPVPVTVVYFKGSKQNNGHLLDWKVTCYNSPTVTMQLERSADGRKFTSINNQTETALRCLQPFSFVDAAPLSGINYYRLKSIDIDGKETYSHIVALLNKEKGFEMVSMVPNPVKDNAILSVTSAVKSSMEIVVSDLSGKQLYKQRVSMIAGNNQLPLNVSNLPAGIYQVTGITADGMTRTLRFVKQ